MSDREPAIAEAESIAALIHSGSRPRAPLALLPAAARAEDLSLTDAQLRQFTRYRDLLLDWNARINLTAVSDPVEVERRLFLDGLRLLPAIDRVSSGQAAPRLIDIGSGGGFPGLVLKIARPALDVTLVDATGKKVRFLDDVIASLELEGVRARQARAEELGHDKRCREMFDLVTARAVAPLPVLLEYAMPLLRVGGVGLFPKGRDLAAELAAAKAAAATWAPASSRPHCCRAARPAWWRRASTRRRRPTIRAERACHRRRRSAHRRRNARRGGVAFAAGQGRPRNRCRRKGPARQEAAFAMNDRPIRMFYRKEKLRGACWEYQIQGGWITVPCEEGARQLLTHRFAFYRPREMDVRTPYGVERLSRAAAEQWFFQIAGFRCCASRPATTAPWATMSTSLAR